MPIEKLQKPINKMAFHPMSEKLVEFLCEKVQNFNPQFFRMMVCYHFVKAASIMRVDVLSADRGKIPINAYLINLAPSGQGKGFSTSLMEEQVMDKFQSIFLEHTYPVITEQNLASLAILRANINDTDESDELNQVKAEFGRTGDMLMSFDSAGSVASVKQLRHKCLMSKIGALNFEIDEIGTNLTSNLEILGAFLEMYDLGKIKEKLTKHTRDNVRGSNLEGRVPANLLMFGEPSKLLDGINGSKQEEEFYTLLQIGYARRCFFGYTRESRKKNEMTAEEIFDALVDSAKDAFVKKLSAHFGQLAAMGNYGKTITMSRDISIELIRYKMICEDASSKLPEHRSTQKTELEHRYFKAMKLAGAYAFIDGDDEVSFDNLYAAIRLTEESGKAFSNIHTREKNYAKLAKYIASLDNELTHVDLEDEMPFYKGSQIHQRKLIDNAIAWGYKNHIIIKKTNSNNIEFLRGETLRETSLDKVRIAYSDDQTLEYKGLEVPFNKLSNMTQKSGLHWVNHYLKNGYRHDDNVIPGFNLVVFDVDTGFPIKSALDLMKGYQCLFYTTKKHTAAHNRYRIVMPIRYFLELDAKEYQEFMENLYTWLPFEVDPCKDRPRKWLTHPGHFKYVDGEDLLDPLPFIPKTAKADERQKLLIDTQSMTNLERWFLTNTADGNRNKQMLRYALMMVDTGADFDQVRDSVLALNAKLEDKMEVREIDTTIMATVAKTIKKRDKS